MNISFKFLKNRRFLIWGLPVFIFLLFFFFYPLNLENDPGSTVILDRNRRLLAAQVASDGQWRIHADYEIPEKIRHCIVNFEDRWFYYHPGINLPAIGRALYLNIREGRIVSGGSTITNQLVRLARKSRPRTMYEKLLENLLALRLELYYSKDELLKMYLDRAPFGGNVVGLQAASWRYYGRPADQLSWAEAATMAVLPNAPALIFPGKNHHLLEKKRNRLLDILLERGLIDSLACDLAKLEPLPDKPLDLPVISRHLMHRIMADGFSGLMVKTSIDAGIQWKVNQIMKSYQNGFAGNQIMNAAVLVVSLKDQKVLAYQGNFSGSNPNGGDVDMINAMRSTGSLLKPFLYAKMLDQGLIMPSSLLPDIPTQIASFRPENFTRQYFGAVPADDALARSLNVPAVRMLRMYGVNRFLMDLSELGIQSIDKSASHYGLTLILGGAESSLWQMTSAYAKLAGTLLKAESDCADHRFGKVSYLLNPGDEIPLQTLNLSPAAAWLTFEALAEANRPEENMSWELFKSTGKIAWKTGTSFGFRDAWSIGLTPDYVVGVWVGNASGEGRPGLTGFTTAAPILFDVFSILGVKSWFDVPYEDLIEVEICSASGYKAAVDCPDKKIQWSTPKSTRSEICPYHKQIHLNAEETHRVQADCYPVERMKTKSWFILPPAMEWYYRARHPEYEPLPPWLKTCSSPDEASLELIYPQDGIRIYIPKTGSENPFVYFEAVHRMPGAELFWFLDEIFIGRTNGHHQLKVYPPKGEHILTLADEDGNRISVKISVL